MIWQRFDNGGEIMKKSRIIFSALALAVSDMASAANTNDSEVTNAVLPSERGKSLAAAKDGWTWVDGKTFKLEGKPFENADGFYSRLPLEVKTNVVWGTWAMSKCPAGMSFVFKTTSPKLRVRWSLAMDRLALAHMAATGVSGVDLYSYTKEGVWRFVKVGIPRKQYSNEVELAVSPKKLYRLYLPLYNGLKDVHFGIKDGAKIESAELPNRDSLKPVVFYGGSSTQGACVSRPGNAWPNIVGRILDAPTICMGFNGQGKMLLCEADILARIDASAYCFLCLGNMVEANYREHAETFLRRLKELKPETPIVFGSFHYPLVVHPRKHAFAAELKEKLRKEDPEKWANFDIVPLWEMCSRDCDGTVDGGHPNDYGSFRMAEAFSAAVRRMEKGKK